MLAFQLLYQGSDPDLRRGVIHNLDDVGFF